MASFTFYNFIFFEKSGCGGNARQKELLKKHNITFEVKDLLNTKWSYDDLVGYFEGLEIVDMFNSFAPQIRDKQIDISKLSFYEAINLMIRNPILIKRPLLDINGVKICGFDIEKINKLLNTNIDTNKKLNTCSSSNSCTNV
jgi:nitrogenase-associated protein